MRRHRFAHWVSVLAVAFVIEGGTWAQTPAHWNGGNGNWTTAALWSGGVVPNNGTPPGSTYDAFIDAAGTYTVTLNSPITVNNLTMNDTSATLNVTSNTLSIVNNMTLTAGLVQLTSGTIMGGSISAAGTAHLVPGSSFNNRLDGVSLGVNVLDMTASSSHLQLTNGTNFTGGPGAITLGANAAIYMAQNATINSGVSFNLGANSVLSADGFTATLGAATPQTITVTVNGNSSLGSGFFSAAANSVLVNQGTIHFGSGVVGTGLNINTSGAGSRFDNQGIIDVSSAGAANTVNLNGTFTNSGVFQVGAGGILNFNSPLTTSTIGNLNHTGGVVNIATTLTNTASVLALTDTGTNPTGSITLASGTITGGSITAAGAAHLVPNSSFNNKLDGVTIGVNVLDMTASSSHLQLTNGSNFTGGPGAISLGPNAALYMLQNTTINSGISFNLGGSSVLSADGFTATLGAATPQTVTITVNGNSSIGGGFFSSAANSVLSNQGTIHFGSGVVGATLNVSSSGTGSRFDNQGIVDISSSGSANTVSLNGPFTNSGVFQVSTGGILNFNSPLTTSNIGNLNHTGGAVNIATTLTNTSAVLALTDSGTNPTGSITLAAGTITGGSITAAGAAHLVPNSSFSNKLDGVTLGVNVLDMTANSSHLQLTNGTNFTGGPGAIVLGPNAALYMLQNTTINSGVSFTMGGGNSTLSADGFTATLGAATPQTVTVTLNANATLAAGAFGNAPNSVLANQGTIQFGAGVSGATLTVTAAGTGSRFDNQGIVIAAAATGTNTVSLNGSFTNSGVLQVSTGGILNFNSPLITSNIGNLNHTGGIVNIATTLTNTSAVLALTDAGTNPTGSITLNAGTITGGSVTAAGATHLVPNSSFSNKLDGVSVGVNVLDMAASSSHLQLINGTNFVGGPGSITLGPNAAIYMAQNTTINSGVSFTMGGGNSTLSADGFTATLGAATPQTDTVILNASATLAAGAFGNAPNSVLVNQGTIHFGSGAVNTSLTVTASGSGSRFDNQGIVDVSSSGAANNVNLNGSFTNSGVFQVGTGGNLNFNSPLTTANIGNLNHTGGTINIGTTLTNTGATLALTDAGPFPTGSIVLNAGTIIGGSITAAGAAQLVPNSSFANILNGVSIAAGALNMTGNSSHLQLQGGATLAPGNYPLGPNAALFFQQTSATASGVNFTLAGGNSVLSADGGNTVTLGAATPSTVTVTVNPGPSSSASIGTSLFSALANNVLINQGTIQFAPTSTNATLILSTSGTAAGNRIQNQGIISANVSGTTVTFVNNSSLSFTNSGTLLANGGTINIPATTPFTNYDAPTQTLTGGTYQVFPSSVINFNGRTVTTLGPGTSVLMDGASSVFTAATNSITTNNGTFSIGNGKLNTVPGGTLTNNGTLIVGTTQGDVATLTGSVNVGPAGIVKGTGTIAGGISLVSGSTLAPGGSPGVLTVTGAVAMSAGTNFSVQLNGPTAGTGYSQLNLTGGGSVNLNNATLAPTLGYVPSPADTFTIITGGPVAGIFNGLPNNSQIDLGSFNGQPYKATIIYTSNSVFLTSPVPEPATILGVCAAVGCGVGAWRRWRATSRRAALTDMPLNC